MFAAGKPARAVLAWVAAWGVVTALAAVAEVVDGSFFGRGQAIPNGVGVWMLPAALPFAIWIPVARVRQWRRPLTDIVLFAAGSLVAPLFTFVIEAARGSETFWPTAHEGVRLLGGLSTAQYALYVASFAMAFGVLAGLLYWVFAGRPRP